MEALKGLLLTMDPDFPDLETRAAALSKAGFGTESRLKAALLEDLQQVPSVLPGDARLIWNFYHSSTGDTLHKIC